ncbi:uncharacterized protein JCM15063_003783 [Sporobolomyces koalae]|uniref:uncharacterized protein n=1 Tax=Sporobolomyces koalae TaxID=500713 RepID=UPI00317F6E6C
MPRPRPATATRSRPDASDQTREKDRLTIERLHALGYSIALPALDTVSSITSSSTPLPSRLGNVLESKQAIDSETPALRRQGNDWENTRSQDTGSSSCEEQADPPSNDLPPPTMKKEDLTLDDLDTIVEAHRALARGKGRERQRGGADDGLTPSQREAKRLLALNLESVPQSTPSTPRKRQNSFRTPSPTTPSASSSPASPATSELASPTRRLGSPSKRRNTIARAAPLLALFAASTTATSLLSTCESLLQLAPTLSLSGLIELSRALQENEQMLAIAQAQAVSSGRTFGSSFDTLARLVSTSPQHPSSDPSHSTLVAAKALNLFAIPSEAHRLLTLPTEPTPAPLLILSTPHTLCYQCGSAITLRTKPNGPVWLVTPAEPARPVLVATHVCSNSSCRARHAPDHVEITHENRTVWIWENNAKYSKVGERVWVTRDFSKHFAALLLQQSVSPGGYASVWNSLHASGKGDADQEDREGMDSEEEDFDEIAATSSSETATFKLSSAHVWRSFVTLSSTQHATERRSRLLTIPRPSSETLVRFVNRNLLSPRPNVHVLEPHHDCTICTKPRSSRWRAGPATSEERKHGVRWAGSSLADLRAGNLRDDSTAMEGNVSFAVCDGISIGHLLCAYPGCANPPIKATRKARFCKSHVRLHKRCGIFQCGRPIAISTVGSSTTEACCDPSHQSAWYAFVKKRESIVSRGWIRQRTLPRTPGGSNIAFDGPLDSEKRHETGPKTPAIQDQILHSWALRRSSKLQLLVAACGTPLAWTTFAEGESPRSVLQFLSSAHEQFNRDPAISSATFPSYIAYDRACDVLRQAAEPPTASPSSQDPFETPRKHRRRQDPTQSLPSFLKTSRLVVTGFHQQCHSTSDAVCQSFCNSAPLDGSAPDLVIPYVSKGSHLRVFERAFNTSAAEQLNSSLRGFTHLLQSMKADNFEFLLNCILMDKKAKIERRK